MDRAATSAAKRGGTSSVKRTNTYGRFSSTSASLVSSKPGSGKENSLLDVGHTGAKSKSNGLAAILCQDFDDDEDDNFGAVGRSKRNRGGVCGTPTDEDGSERPRVTSPRLQDVVRHYSIFDACDMEAPPSKLEIPKLSGIPPCAEGGSSPPFTKTGGRADGSNGYGGSSGSSTGGQRRTKGAYASKASSRSSGSSKKQNGTEEEKLIANAPLEDVQHLHAALVKCTKQSTRGGFGKKPAVSCGSSWPLLRRQRFVDWVFSLGLTPDVTGKWYECASAEQARSLTRMLADAMASSAAETAAAESAAAAETAAAATVAGDAAASDPLMAVESDDDLIEEDPVEEEEQRSRSGANPVKRRPGGAAVPTKRRTQPSIDEDDIEEFPEDCNDGGDHPHNNDLDCDDDDDNSNGSSNSQPFGGFAKSLRAPERPTLRRMASNASNTSSEDSLASTQSSASSTATTAAATVVGTRTRSSRLRDRRGLVRPISLSSSHDSAISASSSSSNGGSSSSTQSTPRSGGNGGSARSLKQQQQQSLLRRSGSSGGSSPDSGARSNLTPQRRLSSSVDWDAAGKESRLTRMVNAGSNNDCRGPPQAPTRTVSDPLRGTSYSTSTAGADDDDASAGSAKTAEGADLYTARRVRSRTNSEDVVNSQSSGSSDDLKGAWRKASSSSSHGVKGGLLVGDDHDDGNDDDGLDPSGVLLQPRRPPSALSGLGRATSAALPGSEGPPMLVSAAGSEAAAVEGGVGRRRKALTRSASTPTNANRPHALSNDSFLSVSRPRRGQKATSSSTSSSSSSTSSSAMEPDSATAPPPSNGEGMLRQPLLRVNSLGPLADNLNGMHLFSAASHGRGGGSSSASPRLSLSHGDLPSNLKMRGLLEDEDDVAAGAPHRLTSEGGGRGGSRDFDDDENDDEDGNDFGIGLRSLREQSREQSRCASDEEEDDGEVGAAEGAGGGAGTQDTEILTQETEIDDDDEFHSCNSHFNPTPFACFSGGNGDLSREGNGANDPLETSGGSDQGLDTSATGGGFLRRPATCALGGNRDSLGSDDGAHAFIVHRNMREAHNPMLQQLGGGRSSSGGGTNGAGHQRYSYSGRPADRNNSSSSGLHHHYGHHGQQQVPPARSSNSRLSGASAADGACGDDQQFSGAGLHGGGGGHYGRDRDSFGAAGEHWDMMDAMAGFSHSSSRRPPPSSSVVASRSSLGGRGAGGGGGSGRLSAGLSGGPLFQDAPPAAATSGSGGAGQQSSSGPSTPMLQLSSARFGSAHGFGPGAASSSSNGKARHSLPSGCVLGSFGGTNGDGGTTPMQQCPTPGPAATPQQTPQQLMGWGARPDFGDWGATVGLAAGPLRQLIERFEQQRASMQSRGQLSPFCRGRFGTLTMAANGASSGGGEGSNDAMVPVALPTMPSLGSGPPSQVGGPTNLFGTGSPTGSPSSMEVAAAGAGLAAPSLCSFSSSFGVSNFFLAAGAAGSSLALGPSFADRHSHSRHRTSSSSVSPPRPGTSTTASNMHGVSFAPGVSPVHGTGSKDNEGDENGGDSAFNSAEKDRARARRARSLAKFHRVSVGMSARKSLGGSRSSIGGFAGGNGGRPSLLLGALAAGVEYSSNQYSARRSSVKLSDGGGAASNRTDLGAPPAKPRFRLAASASTQNSSNGSVGGNAGGLTVESFRGVSIVGGQFLRRFEAGLPVVGLPPPSQLHAAQAVVVGADLTRTGLLKLTVHHATTGARKTVQIYTTRNRCHTLRVFPTGLLVSAQAFKTTSSSSMSGGRSSSGAGARVAYFLKQELYQFTGLLDALAPTLANNAPSLSDLPPPPPAPELQLPAHATPNVITTTTTTPRGHRNAPLRTCRMSQGGADAQDNQANDDDDDGLMRDPGVTPGPSNKNGHDGSGSAVKHSGATPALDAMNIFSPISGGGGKMGHHGNHDEDVFVNMALESSVCMDEISGLEDDDEDEASAALSNSFRRGLRVATPTASGALVVAAAGGTPATSYKANKEENEEVASDTDTAIDDDDDEELAATQLTQECDAELMNCRASDLPVLLTAHILSFLTVADLLQGPVASSGAWGSSSAVGAAGGCVAVCRAWSVAAVHAHASLVAGAAVADPTPSSSSSSKSNNASDGPPVALNLRSNGRSAATSEQPPSQPPALVRQRSMLPPGAANSTTSKGGAVIVKSWAMLCDHMPWGAFLSEGAYKKVYRVVNAQAMPPTIEAAKHSQQPQGGGNNNALVASSAAAASSGSAGGVEWVQEAVSVMNVKAIIENGAGSVVQQELKVSLLVSSLVRRGACPNFVETFGVFGADFAPPPEVWGSEARKQPHGKNPSAYPQRPLKLANQLTARGAATAATNGSSSSSISSAGEKDNAQAVREHHSAAVKSLQPWRGDAAKRVRASSNLPRGRHQYIRMELCTHGDLEVFLQKQPSLTLTNEALPPLAFQMVFSLYCAQQEFSLRHYDVKLLNFLLKEVPPTLVSPSSPPPMQLLNKEGSKSASSFGALAPQEEEAGIAVSYGVPGQAFRFTLPAATGPTSHRLWVKLGDFGTADVNPATLGAPVGLEQFTTLENTPIEQLLLGSGATQAYAADTWALGLSLLHLFTGHAPYEELMVDVVCPEELRVALEAVWQDPALELQYGVVADAAGEEEQASIDMDLSSSSHGEMVDGEGSVDQSRDSSHGGCGSMDRTLADTLYRYAVLCGLPEAAVVDATPAWHQNPILRACLVHLRTSDLPGALQRPGSTGGSGRGRGSGAPTKAAAKKLANAFEKHRNLWSLAKGNAPPMAAARTKLDAMGGAGLLQEMLAFDPLQRPTMLEALQSDLFADLRCAESDARAAHHAFLKYL